MARAGGRIKECPPNRSARRKCVATPLDLLVPEAGAIYVMDRGYIDFARLHTLHPQLCLLSRAPNPI
jgi:hypothetical protein